MSSQEDDSGPEPSLKDMVTATLNANGVLGKLKAQLRASVFLTLEDEFKDKNLPIVNEKAKNILSTPNGRAAAILIQDFLQCLDLEFTMAVFGPETDFSQMEEFLDHQTHSRKLWRRLFPSENREDSSPILLRLLDEISQMRSKSASEETATNSDLEDDTIQDSQQDRSQSSVSVPNPVVIQPKTNEQIEYSSGSSASKELNKPFQKHNSDIINEVNNTERNSENSTSDDSCTISKNDSTSGTVGKKTPEEKDNIKSDQRISDVEKEEDDLCSLSGVKELPEEKEGNEISEIEEEALDVPEDIDEDIYIDDLLSSASESTNKTKDVSESKATGTPDYQESL